MNNEPRPEVGETWELLLGSDRQPGQQQWRPAEVLKVEQDQVTLDWPAYPIGRLNLPGFHRYIAAGRFRPRVARHSARG
jgi:hypothetical protein